MQAERGVGVRVVLVVPVNDSSVGQREIERKSGILPTMPRSPEIAKLACTTDREADKVGRTI